LERAGLAHNRHDDANGTVFVFPRAARSPVVVRCPPGFPACAPEFAIVTNCGEVLLPVSWTPAGSIADLVRPLLDPPPGSPAYRKPAAASAETPARPPTTTSSARRQPASAQARTGWRAALSRLRCAIARRLATPGRATPPVEEHPPRARRFAVRLDAELFIRADLTKEWKP
jgi:hypothetical protein